MQAPAAGGNLGSVCPLDLHLQEALKAVTNNTAKGLVRELGTQTLQSATCHQCGYPAWVGGNPWSRFVAALQPCSQCEVCSGHLLAGWASLEGSLRSAFRWAACSQPQVCSRRLCCRASTCAPQEACLLPPLRHGSHHLEREPLPISCLCCAFKADTCSRLRQATARPGSQYVAKPLADLLLAPLGRCCGCHLCCTSAVAVIRTTSPHQKPEFVQSALSAAEQLCRLQQIMQAASVLYSI